jgi:hypothetical protein
MRVKVVAMLGIVALLAGPRFVAPVAGQGEERGLLPVAVEISHRLKNLPAPAQPSLAQAGAIAAASPTTSAQCGGDGATRVITLSSFDPAHPGSQEVVFWKETRAESPGKADLWVAWDFLSNGLGGQDVIQCEQLAALQDRLDGIIATDVSYFGDFLPRPVEGAKLNIMVYSIVDEGYFETAFPFNVSGFFWPGLNHVLNTNMLFLDSYDWTGRLGSNGAHANQVEATLAHTLEHLIHSDRDPDEAAWVDEGLADLAGYLNGYGHPESAIVYYLAHHRTSLTVWDGGLESQGASYLFQLYLLENFGRRNGKWDTSWTRDMAGEGLNSIAGIQARTGRTMNGLYDAWVLANFLDRPDLKTASGLLLGYREIDLAPFLSRDFSPWSIQRAIAESYGQERRTNLPVSRLFGGYQAGLGEPGSGSLPPYAPLYSSFRDMEPLMSVRVRGDMVSGVAPHAGYFQMASGLGNVLMDRRLRLTAPVGGALSFWTWYEMERDWDYGFVEVSTDGGAFWTAIPGTITRLNTNPNSSTAWRNSLVGGQASSSAAITGASGGWVRANFTLPAASNVLVRFSYYTDEAVNGKGWFIDDVTTDATGGPFATGAGIVDGFEADATGWSLGGWQLTTGLFPNDWAASYVSPVFSQGRPRSVQVGTFDSNSTGGLFEWETGVVDNSRLNQDSAMVVISNRPGESPFAGAYQLTVGRMVSVVAPAATATVTLTGVAGISTVTPTLTPTIAATANTVITATPTVAATVTPSPAPNVSTDDPFTGPALPTPAPSPGDR